MKGLFIDYKWCTGCHSCEMACKVEKNLKEGQFGIKLTQMGPWKHDDESIDFNYVPVPTAFCDLCYDRIKEGRLPSCVHHCQSLCMDWGELEDLAKKVTGPNAVIYSIATPDDIKDDTPEWARNITGKGSEIEASHQTSATTEDPEMDEFKVISELARAILYDANTEIRFHKEPEAVVRELLPAGYEGTDEDFNKLVSEIKERVKIWARNTGVAASLED